MTSTDLPATEIPAVSVPAVSVPAVYGQFGQALAFAERTLGAILREHLARRDITPGTWYALKLTAARPSREALTSDLRASRDLYGVSVPDLLAGLEAEGLISGGDPVSLTAEGEARFRDLREYVVAPTVRLLSQFDLGDIETTVRTIKAITERAALDAV
jgi:hypothetical protein